MGKAKRLRKLRALNRIERRRRRFEEKRERELGSPQDPPRRVYGIAEYFAWAIFRAIHEDRERIDVR